VVLLHIPSGTYLSLDRSAARIVDLLNADADPHRAANALVTQFGISLEQARTDVAAVISSVQGFSAKRSGKARHPTLLGSRNVARSWRRMDGRTRRLALHVAAVVMAVEIGLAVTSVRRVAQWAGVPMSTDQTHPPTVQTEDGLSGLSEREMETYSVITWVLACWVYDGTCLRQALTLGWFLRRRHPVLLLGLIDDDEAIAHAWIEVEGTAINGRPESSTFVSGSFPGLPRIDPYVVARPGI
jgi:hypothetical protein